MNILLKNDVKEIAIWNCKIGLNNKIYKKVNCKKTLFVKLLKGYRIWNRS